MRRENNRYCAFDDKISIGGKCMTLKGVVVHSGLLSDGHYYSYVKSGEEWLKFNDHLVTKVTDEVFKQNRGGMHPYRHLEQPFSAYGFFFVKDDTVEKVSSDQRMLEEVKMSESRSIVCRILTSENVRRYTGPGFFHTGVEYPQTQFYVMKNDRFREINIEKKYHYVFEIRDGCLTTKVRWEDGVMVFLYCTNNK